MLCINKHCHHSAFNSFILSLLLVRLSIPLLSTISITTVTLLVATNIPPNLQSLVTSTTWMSKLQRGSTCETHHTQTWLGDAQTVYTCLLHEAGESLGAVPPGSGGVVHVHPLPQEVLGLLVQAGWVVKLPCLRDPRLHHGGSIVGPAAGDGHPVGVTGHAHAGHVGHQVFQPKRHRGTVDIAAHFKTWACSRETRMHVWGWWGGVVVVVGGGRHYCWVVVFIFRGGWGRGGDGNFGALVARHSLFGFPLSGTTFLLTSDTAVLSHSSKLLLKTFSSLLLTLSCSNPHTGTGCYTWIFSLFYWHLHWLRWLFRVGRGAGGGGEDWEIGGEVRDCDFVCMHVCVHTCMCVYMSSHVWMLGVVRSVIHY